MADRKIGDLQVWWIPQVPMNPFTVDVATVEEGAKILKVLADYDAFQFENRVKGDYSNAGGLQQWCANAGKGRPGFEEWYDPDTDDDLDAYMRRKTTT